jgi:putative addiction module component (TIGR02574 family)
VLKAQIQGLLDLSFEERTELVEILSRSLQEEPLPLWQEQLLAERVREADENPDAFLSWEEVEAETLAELHSRRAS